MKRLYLTFAATLISVVILNAQTLDDIELFNTRDLHGTPRFTAMGGAFTALGNDLSAIHLNPASSSVFRQDNLGLSLGFQTRSGDQSFYNGTSPSSDFSFLFENVGVVKKFETGGYNNKTELAFSLGYTKLAEFNREYSVTADRTIGEFGEGTLVDYWFPRELPDGSFDGAFDLAPGQLDRFGLFEELAASQAGLFYQPDDTIRDISLGNANTQTNSKIRYRRNESGSFNEAHIGLAGAYQDVFHYGIALGFPTLSYLNEDKITEYSLPTDTFPFDANSYTLTRTNDIYGNGVNIKLGVIVKPAQWFRLGLAYESPSWYTVVQLYNIDVTAQFDNGDFGESDVLSTGEYSYKLRTPSIYRVGGAFIFGKQDLSAWIMNTPILPKPEPIPITAVTMCFEDDLQDANSSVSNVMTASQAVKVGAEYRLGPVMLRAGYGFRESMYQNPQAFKSDQSTISTGIGYQNEDFSIDLSYSRSSFSRQDFVHPFYTETENGAETEELVDSDMIRSNIILGVGIRF